MERERPDEKWTVGIHSPGYRQYSVGNNQPQSQSQLALLLAVQHRQHQPAEFGVAQTALCLSLRDAVPAGHGTPPLVELVPALSQVSVPLAACRVCAAVRPADAESRGSDGRAETWTVTVPTPLSLSVSTHAHYNNNVRLTR